MIKVYFANMVFLSILTMILLIPVVLLWLIAFICKKSPSITFYKSISFTELFKYLFRQTVKLLELLSRNTVMTSLILGTILCIAFSFCRWQEGVDGYFYGFPFALHYYGFPLDCPATHEWTLYYVIPNFIYWSLLSFSVSSFVIFLLRFLRTNPEEK